jgi:hypothetical protein
MTNNPDDSEPQFGFIDNSLAPDVFADNVTGLFFFGGNIRLTLETLRVNHVTTPGPVNRVVIGRLILPLQAAKNLRDTLVEYLKKIESPESQAQAPGTQTIQ